ncbi:MAG: polysaccharide pyruvyl transferase family protein [Oscillospiraceae bacterium]
MNILLVGYLDRNFGDDMMIRIVCNQLKDHKLFIKEYKKELLLPFKNIQNFHDIDEYPNIKIDRILRVTGSGFMITNKVGIYYGIIACFKHLKKIPKAVIGCNVGPIYNRFASFLLKLDMKTNKVITVRDEFSLKFVKDKLKKVKTNYFPDIVFGIPNEWLPDNRNEGCLGISAYRRGNADNLSFYKKLAKIADDFITKNNKKVLLFAFDTENENDIIAAITIKQFCKHNEMIEIIVHNDNGNNIISNMSRCGKFVAVRLHSAIMAIRLGIPFAIIAYSEKTSRVLDGLEYAEKRFYVDNFEADEVVSFLEKAKPFFVNQKVFSDARLHVEMFRKEML